MMHIFIVAGFLALAGAQRTTTLDPLLIIDIFGPPPTVATPPTPTRQPLEEVTQSTRQPKTDRSTIESSLLIELFGRPPTASTFDPSVLNEIFGPPLTSTTPKSEAVDHSNGASQDKRLLNVEGRPTVDPSVLIDIFGTSPTPTTPKSLVAERSNGTYQGKRLVHVEGLSPVDSLIIDVFGTPPTTSSTTQQLEDITVKPTEGTSVYVDQDGQNCQCVPYYLCDANNVGVDVNNASVTGWGTLDIRFGEDDDNTRQCQESVEVCCKIPKDATEVPKPPKPIPQPDPTKVKGCGYRNPQGLGGVTVTGGVGLESQFGEFPWVVALLDNRNSSYVGVGVLINPQVVMTGAHVIQKYGPGTLKVRAGEWDTQTNKEIYPYVEKTVDNAVLHENFMPKSLKNDIALLHLDSPFEITEHVNVICMPDQEEVFDASKNCVANGWGKTHFGQKNVYAVILKKIEVDMVPYNRCNALLKRTRLGHNFKLHNSFVCAGGEAGKDTCQGDGGAPLACPIGNNRYKLTGLVAWGIGCGQQDVPAVYTNVPLFREWVDEKMADWGLQATSYRISK